MDKEILHGHLVVFYIGCPPTQRKHRSPTLWGTRHWTLNNRILVVFSPAFQLVTLVSECDTNPTLIIKEHFKTLSNTRFLLLPGSAILTMPPPTVEKRLHSRYSADVSHFQNLCTLAYCYSILLLFMFFFVFFSVSHKASNLFLGSSLEAVVFIFPGAHPLAKLSSRWMILSDALT